MATDPGINDEGPAHRTDDDRTVVRPAGSLARSAAAVDPDATVIRPAGPVPDPDATVVRPPAAGPAPTPGTAPAPAVPAPPRSAPAAPAPPAPAADAVPIALAPGTRLHEYRIDKVLGQGGFGITYLATDVNLHASVAIKEYLPASLALRARDQTMRPRRLEDLATLLEGLDQFLVEARTLATFRHPNIVRVARFFEANRSAYMVLDYERGQSLGDWWRSGRRSAPALTRLLGTRAKTGPAVTESAAPPVAEPELLLRLNPLLDGLALVHRSGILHRDIKPDNVCVRHEDGSLVLLDFGAARSSAPSDADADADADAPIVLTPGYAPLEQYLGEHQGPWTDVYALGALLYWMVSGRKPREAPERQLAPQADVPAETAGAGRYSPEFLRAIDWALALRPQDRPQDVDAFRRALCGAHAGSLDLRNALVAGTEEAGADAPRERPRRRAWRAGSWPLAVKMVLALVLAAVMPMAITAVHNYRSSVEALAAAERRGLEHVARTTAGRISQLLEDQRRVLAFLASEGEVAAVLAAPDGAARAALRERFARLVAANADIHLLTLMDAGGTAIVSTAPEVVDGNFAFRDYFKTALAGTPNVTSIIVGAVAGRAGSYLAHPVRNADGRVAGVAVLRLRAEAISAIVDGARSSIRQPFLIDGDGVLIDHRDPALRFRSLATLSPQALAAIQADQRFRRDRIDSLDMPLLAAAMVGARQEGHVDFFSTISRTREVAGFAPVAGHDWVVGVTETRDSFEAPLLAMLRQVISSTVLVGLVFVLLAMLFARSIVRPVQRLTDAAHALKRGDYDAAHVQVTSADELGALGRTFNVMIDVLRQRERERADRKP